MPARHLRMEFECVSARLWAQLYRSGVVVANMDTASIQPPDLTGKWRGGANSWFDPHGDTPLPTVSPTRHADMSIMVGGAAGGSASVWLRTPAGSAKLYNDAGRPLHDIHLAFQWLLDPDGNPATVDAPDVVNASWDWWAPPDNASRNSAAISMRSRRQHRRDIRRRQRRSCH